MDLLGRKSQKKLDEFVVIAVRYHKFLEAKLGESTRRADRLQADLIEAKLTIENLSKPKTVKNRPLYLNETEEDIEYAFKNELISRHEYEDMLRQLEFDNTDITFDLEQI